MPDHRDPKNFSPFNCRSNVYLFALILLFTLFTLTFFHPVMFLNDEWITGNQLSQLYQGHQILFAEGKYGFDDNGTPYNYFIEKGLILQYTTYLPLLSYPFLIFVKIVGPSIPFLISTIWTILLIIFGLFSKKKLIFNDKSILIGNVCIVTSFLIYLLNLTFFSPMNINSDFSYDELVGVGIYHFLLLVILTCILFLICKNIFNDIPFSLLATITCISNSSYLFWAISLKDHIDAVLLVSLILYFLIRFQKTDDIWNFPVCFILSGILTWVRPEYGAIMAIGIFIILLILFSLNQNSMKSQNNKGLIYFSPFFYNIGIIPLFVGNYLTTGNPLKLAWQISIPNNQIPLEEINYSAIPSETNIQTIIHTIIDRIIPHSNTLFQDIYGFLVNPATLKVPIFGLTPLFVLGILYLPFMYFFKKIKFNIEEKNIIAILFILVLITVITYSSSITGLNTSMGVYPDVRYLSPVYIPLNLIGLILIRKIITNTTDIQKILSVFFRTLIIGVGIGIGSVTYFHSQNNFWDILLPINGVIPILIYAVILIAFLTFCRNFFDKNKETYLPSIIGILIAIPLIWQIIIIFLVSLYPMTFISYPPFLPIMSTLFNFLTSFGEGL